MIVDTTYPAADKVTLHVSMDIAIPPRFFRGEWQQVAYDAGYFNAVVARLITDEARVQYTAALAKERNR